MLIQMPIRQLKHGQALGVNRRPSNRNFFCMLTLKGCCDQMKTLAAQPMGSLYV
jgi:hypothetical protein